MSPGCWALTWAEQRFRGSASFLSRWRLSGFNFDDSLFTQRDCPNSCNIAGRATHKETL
jgi:hypothetical protein